MLLSHNAKNKVATLFRRWIAGVIKATTKASEEDYQVGTKHAGGRDRRDIIDVVVLNRG